MPKVSVILTVYNGADTMERCLGSIVSQTLRDIEIIVVNDGSTDATLDLVQAWAAKDERIRILNQANAGAGAARNAGLKEATGEYLSFLDADDFFEPDMLETAYRQAAAAQADLIVFGCDMVENEVHFPCDYSIRQKLLPPEAVFSGQMVSRDVFKLFVGWAWDKLFRADFVREKGLRFQQQRTTNDMLFVFSALASAQRVCVCQRVLAHHTSSAGTISATREKSWQCFYEALLALRDYLKAQGLYERFEQDYINYSLHFSLWNLNTLKQPVRSQLAQSLRSGWFEQLGVIEHQRSYFYNQSEYRSYCRLMAGNAGFEPDSKWRRGWLCLREHGLRYTVQYALKKMMKR